ncbi:MAG: hypothetical protein WC123_03540 [Bacilli bacterium]
MIEKVRSYFNERYLYVDHYAVSDQAILKMLEEPYLKNKSFNQQMDLLYDWMLSQDLCDVTP